MGNAFRVPLSRLSALSAVGQMGCPVLAIAVAQSGVKQVRMGSGITVQAAL